MTERIYAPTTYGVVSSNRAAIVATQANRKKGSAGCGGLAERVTAPTYQGIVGFDCAAMVVADTYVRVIGTKWRI